MQKDRILVEKGNECFVYVELIQSFPHKIKSFVCSRLNFVYVVAAM